MLRCVDSKKSALLIAQANVDTSSRPCLDRMVKVGDVLAAQLDHYLAQGCWVIHRKVAATDRALAVLIDEVKNPTFVALKVEQ
jgi:hypothetical protein